jgi:hypothetical protein
MQTYFAISEMTLTTPLRLAGFGRVPHGLSSSIRTRLSGETFFNSIATKLVKLAGSKFLMRHISCKKTTVAEESAFLAQSSEKYGNSARLNVSLIADVLSMNSIR